MTVICRRSAFAASAVAVGGVECGMGGAGFGVDAPSFTPHSEQNFAVGGFSCPHSGQPDGSFVPHSGQNFDPFGTWNWQLGQCITDDP